jgi:hypothetical protein
MAEQAARLKKQSSGPVLIAAGTGHVEYGWGIALRLRLLAPGARIVSVMPWRAPMETVIVDRDISDLLLSGGESSAFPPPDLGDVYYYAGPDSLSKSLGMFTGHRPESPDQLTVLALDEDGVAGEAGLKEGDIILRLGAHLIKNNGDFHSLLARFRAYDHPADLEILRGNKRLRLELPLE